MQITLQQMLPPPKQYCAARAVDIFIAAVVAFYNYTRKHKERTRTRSFGLTATPLNLCEQPRCAYLTTTLQSRCILAMIARCWYTLGTHDPFGRFHVMPFVPRPPLSYSADANGQKSTSDIVSERALPPSAHRVAFKFESKHTGPIILDLQ